MRAARQLAARDATRYGDTPRLCAGCLFVDSNALHLQTNHPTKKKARAAVRVLPPHKWVATDTVCSFFKSILDNAGILKIYSLVEIPQKIFVVALRSQTTWEFRVADNSAFVEAAWHRIMTRATAG